MTKAKIGDDLWNGWECRICGFKVKNSHGRGGHRTKHSNADELNYSYGNWYLNILGAENANTRLKGEK